jgi:MFS-type transporter involved in bile tolerance (Atg22 family)
MSIENERTKLTAALFNGLAIATVATALIVPVVGFAYGAPAPGRWWIAVALAWLVVGWALHLVGRWFLGSLLP